MKIKGASETVRQILEILNISQDFSGKGYYFFCNEIIHIANGVVITVNKDAIRVARGEQFKFIDKPSELWAIGFLEANLFNERRKGER
jgi:hypothetical protein